MASTYSTNLAIELIGTGDQSGTWGTTTNTNLGTLIEQSISGYVTQAITDGADTTITIPNGASGVARNMSLELTGALTAARNLIVPANKKLYFVYNNTTGGGFAVTVKVSGQTGVSVPNGKKMVLVSNGTDIVEAVTYHASLTLGTALPVASGGTGATTASAARTALSAASSGANSDITSLTGLTTPLSVAQGGTGVTTSTGSGSNVLSTSPTLVTPILGTPTSATLTNATGLPLTSGVTGTLPVANGGTGATTLTANNVLLGNGTSAFQVVAPGASGNVLTSNGTTWSSSTPSVSSVTGTLAAANGGTGLTSPGASGNILTSNGTSWTSSAPTPGIPSGAVMSFAMNSAPSGWLGCDGSAVSRTTYAALFAAISTTYGTGDGSTTFNLPDLRGYFVRGSGTNSDGTASGTFGAKQADAFRDHTHQYYAPNQAYAASFAGGLNVGGSNAATGGASTGSGTETRPANIAMLYCIKT